MFPLKLQSVIVLHVWCSYWTLSSDLNLTEIWNQLEKCVTAARASDYSIVMRCSIP